MFKNRGENSAFGGGLRAPGGFRGPRFQKFKKPRIQNDGPNTHPKFQHSSSITKCLKIGGKIRLLGGGLRAPGGFTGPRFQKIEKPRIQNGGPNTHPKFQHSSSIRKCSKIGGTASIRRIRRNTSYIDFWSILAYFKVP